MFRKSTVVKLLLPSALMLSAQLFAPHSAHAQTAGQGRTTSDVQKEHDPFKKRGKTWNSQLDTIRKSQKATARNIKTASPEYKARLRAYTNFEPSEIDADIKLQQYFARRKYASPYVF